jgi:predicted hotdog family 3-hydroxylacyl-ACP dehydratase
MIASGSGIFDYLPQRPPMVMIDALLEAEADRTRTRLEIQPGNLFVTEGKFSESGLVENIAQTAAAGVGYACISGNKPVPVGFIAAIRDLSIRELPAAGTRIETETLVTNQVMDVSIVRGTVKQDGRVLAECEMRIFVRPENGTDHG